MRHFTKFAAVVVTGTVLAGVPVFAQKTPKVKSKGEGEAVNAMIQANDPDSRIKAAEALLQKYADTDYKSLALFNEAQSYQQKGDVTKSIVFSEQALDADPTNFQADVLLAKTYGATTKSNDLDKEDKLSKAEKYANAGLEALKTATKPNATLTDAQWTSYKNGMSGECYFALGIVAVFHNKMDDVTADFSKVAEMDDDPVDLIRAGRALEDVKKYDQAIVWIDKAAANPQLKDLAGKEKARVESKMPKK